MKATFFKVIFAAFTFIKMGLTPGHDLDTSCVEYILMLQMTIPSSPYLRTLILNLTLKVFFCGIFSLTTQNMWETLIRQRKIYSKIA